MQLEAKKADNCFLLCGGPAYNRYLPDMGDWFNMTEAKSGREFLENLRRQSGKKNQTFDAFSAYLMAKAREQGVPLY